MYIYIQKITNCWFSACDSQIRQVERNRPPVRFTAERWNVAPTVEVARGRAPGPGRPKLGPQNAGIWARKKVGNHPTMLRFWPKMLSFWV